MPRKPRLNRNSVTTEVVTAKLTASEKQDVERLLTLKNAEGRRAGYGAITLSSYVRALILADVAAEKLKTP